MASVIIITFMNDRLLVTIKYIIYLFVQMTSDLGVNVYLIVGT